MAKATRQASVSKKAVMTELQTLATVAGGMVAGTIAINAAEKVLKVDSSSGLPKRLVAPLVVATGSAIASIKTKNKVVRNVAMGAGAAGVVRSLKAVAPKAAILNGLGAPEDEYLGLTPTSAISQNEDWVYRDSSGHLAFPDLGEANDLGEVEPPQSTGGHFIDPPAYLGETGYDAGITGIEDAQIL